MHAHQQRLIGTPFTLDEGNVLATVIDLAEGDKLEVAILGG